ncbi:hypothetical protein GGR57DRAFT_113042 [Xylariaceae sp. FL1272]|nr:hypothetical protein GGR57DRAFT_113042 [Xylariaceae sp. FL1272]
MDDEPRKKKGFLSGIFRTFSKSEGARKPVNDGPRRASDSVAVLQHRRKPDHRPGTTGTRRRPRRPDPRDSKGKGREQLNGHVPDQGPLTVWPPPGMSSKEELTLGHAMELICRGVPAHKGHKRPITHASDHYYGLYATTAGNESDESDAVNQHDAMTQLMTLRVQGSGPPIYPWETLEQPSYAFGIGSRPGTVTLNSWVTRWGVMPPAIALRDAGVEPREVGLAQIFKRLKELEAGLEDDDDGQMYRKLYSHFLRDPDRKTNPHKRMEQQIMDLVMCLSGPSWIDFTNPKNQVVTKFIYDTGPENHAQYQRFFYQLLLSLELELRISSKLHTDYAKERLMGQIPPKIQWNLALARRWRDNVRIEEYGDTAEHIRLRFKLRKRQNRMLKRFAQMMKWPNLGETEAELRARETDGSLVNISSHALAFFSGLVLPGPTFPFLMMNSLIDVDPDKATDRLALLTHLNPHCGFQYRNSYTYWTSTSIVGKVLAPTCLEVAGWVGPARPSADLTHSQIARVRSRKPRERMTTEDVLTMSERSDPLGPAAEVYPVKEYELLTPYSDDFVDTVRIEMLQLKALVEKSDTGPLWFDASLQFAIDGASWPLRLSYDVCFIHACPCSDGPHPLFFDYEFTTVKADQVVGIMDWSKPSSRRGSKDHSATSTPVGGSSGNHRPMNRNAMVDGADDDDVERVLLVETFGVKDNEVLARAWCSHWGLNAVVADISRTCMACAIREAYAATLTVVILVEDSPEGSEGS